MSEGEDAVNDIMEKINEFRMSSNLIRVYEMDIKEKQEWLKNNYDGPYNEFQDRIFQVMSLMQYLKEVKISTEQLWNEIKDFLGYDDSLFQK